MEDNIFAEESFDREGLDKVLLKVKKMEDVMFADLEDVVNKELVEELVETLESTVESNVDFEQISKDEKVTMMSNIQKILDLDLFPEELKGRIVIVGLKQGWAIQSFGQVDTILIKAVLQLLVRYDTDTILLINFQPNTIPIRYLRTVFNQIRYRYNT